PRAGGAAAGARRSGASPRAEAGPRPWQGTRRLTEAPLGVLSREPLRCPREPRLDDHLLEYVERDALEQDQHGGVSVEVRNREEHIGVVGDERLFRPQVLEARDDDR